MGHQTQVWKCKFCKKLHIYNNKYKYCNCIENMKKPVKQMEEKDFRFMNDVLDSSNLKNISPNERNTQFEYWKKRLNLRIEYLTPLINECNIKGIDLATISKELHEEWLELHEAKRYYNF